MAIGLLLLDDDALAEPDAANATRAFPLLDTIAGATSGAAAAADAAAEAVAAVAAAAGPSAAVAGEAGDLASGPLALSASLVSLFVRDLRGLTSALEAVVFMLVLVLVVI